MTAIMPKDEVQKLLDGTTPGPWLYRPHKYDDWGVVRGGAFNDELGGYPHLAQVHDPERLDDDTLNQHRVSGKDPWEGNARLAAAAPDLARSLIAAHDEIERLRADAQAAVALVVERVVAMDQHVGGQNGDRTFYYVDGPIARKVRALAPADGLALVAELRAERNAFRGEMDRLQTKAMGAVDAARDAEADRDRLAAENAALQTDVRTYQDIVRDMTAQVEALTKSLERVGSGEGMTGTFAIRQNTQEGAELMARMKYARTAIDAATLAAMTPQEQANFDAMMGQRVRLKPNPDGTIPKRKICDCEQSHNGLGMAGRECDCQGEQS